MTRSYRKHYKHTRTPPRVYCQGCGREGRAWGGGHWHCPDCYRRIRDLHEVGWVRRMQVDVGNRTPDEAA